MGDIMNTNSEKFFDEYKRLDRLCSDMYGKQNGVTQYIEDMTHVTFSRYRNISGWEKVLKKLKEYRHLRNELAHGSMSFDDNCCKLEDIEWITDFYDSIINCTDPLAQLRKQTQQNNNVRKNTIENKQKPENKDEPEIIYNYTYSKSVENKMNDEYLKREKKFTNILFTTIVALFSVFIVILIALFLYILFE